MAVKFVLGRAGVGKSRYIFQEIKQELALDQEKSLILLVPEQYTLQAERDLLKTLNLAGIMGVEVLSISRLGHRILNETGRSQKTFINQQGKQMLLQRIMNEEGAQLTIYSRASRQQGFIKGLAELITELKQQDITPEQLQEKASKVESPSLEQKLHDIALLYQHFNLHLQEHYLDMEDYINLVIDRMKDSQLLAGARVWIDSFTTFSSQSLRVIEEIMLRADETVISLTLDPRLDVRDAQIFDLSWYTYHKIKKIADKQGLELKRVQLMEPGAKDKKPALLFLEKELYSYPFQSYEPSCPEISIFGARSMITEVEQLGAQVLELVRERGYRYRDIAVVCNSLGTYGPLIKRVFAKYAIPIFLDEKREIMSNPIIELILSVLELSRGRYRYQDMFRYLKTGFAGLTWEECDILENYVLAYGVKARDWKEGFTRGGEEDLSELNRLRELVFRPLQTLAQELKGPRKVGEISQALQSFLASIQLPAQIELWQEELGEQGRYELQSECRQIWNVVGQMLEEISDLMGPQILGPGEFRQILEAGLESLEMGVIPSTVDQVLVGSIQRSKSHDIKALFVIGANDGILPRGTWPEGILSQEEKEGLGRQGLEIGLSRDLKAAEEEYLIYSALSKPTQILRLSFAWSDLEARALRPSLLIARLRQLYPQLDISHDLIENSQLQRKLISTPSSTYKYLLEQLRSYLDGNEIDPIWWQVHSWYGKHPEWGSRHKALLGGFYHNNQPQPLARKQAQQLYDWPLKASVSRLEKYISCPFAHFMNYGLRPQPRALFELAVPDLGDILHRILQDLSRRLSREGLSWADLDQSTCHRITDQVSEELLAGYHQGIFHSSSRYRYMSQRLQRISRRAAWTLTTHLQKGSFAFAGHELRFGLQDFCDFPALKVKLPGGEVIYLEGRIDRLDLLEEGDEVYIKLIDYKSGQRNLKLDDIYYGLNLQLIIYLAAVMQGLKEKEGKATRAAGMFYFKLDDPLVDKDKEMDQAVIESAINKKLRMTGLMVADTRIIRQLDTEFETVSDIIPVRIKQNGDFSSGSSVLEEEVLEKLVEHGLNRVAEAASGILGGCMELAPVKKGLHTACLYCQYQSICGFDPLLEDNRYINLPACPDEEVLKKIGIGKEGKALDQMDPGTEPGHR